MPKASLIVIAVHNSKTTSVDIQTKISVLDVALYIASYIIGVTTIHPVTETAVCEDGKSPSEKNCFITFRGFLFFVIAILSSVLNAWEVTHASAILIAI